VPQRRSALLKTGLVVPKNFVLTPRARNLKTRNLDWWSPLAKSFLNSVEEVNFPEGSESMRPASRFPSSGTAVCWTSKFDSMKAARSDDSARRRCIS
jgi:hypothetical protein